MDKGIKTLGRQHSFGRVEITSQDDFERFTLKPSKETAEAIAEMEALSVVAEQRLGTFVVG